MHKARPGRGLRPFQVALLILGSRLAPHNLYRYFRGGPGHRREKRINLSTSELCSEAPILCAQSQSTSCGMHRKKLLLGLGAFVGCQGPHAGPPLLGGVRRVLWTQKWAQQEHVSRATRCNKNQNHNSPSNTFVLDRYNLLRNGIPERFSRYYNPPLARIQDDVVSKVLPGNYV